MELQNSQSRKWLLCINNPIDYGFTHTHIISLLTDIKSMVYYCLSDEVGAEGTFHTHIFLACSSAVRFSRIQKLFSWQKVDKLTGELVKDVDGTIKMSNCDIRMAKGTSQENRDYIFKEGKWEKDKKKETNLAESHEEFGDMPVERQGKRNDLDDLYDMIKSGLTNYEIIESNPEYMLMVDKIERVRQINKEELFKNTFRDLKVTYISGVSGTGKTRSVMEQYGYENVYRVTDYKNPWDSYKGQDIIVFEEFFNSLRIQDMLNYLDGYPLELPCRYSNKIACYTKVYIISNTGIEKQYDIVQRDYKDTWKAFLRRIHNIKLYFADSSIKEFKIINNDFIPCISDNPFI